MFEYSITNKKIEALKSDLGEADVIYVEGGSLVHMLNQSRLSGFDEYVRDFDKNGGVYIGTSTGSFIVAPDTEAGLPLESFTDDTFNPAGFGLVNFLIMPHWGAKEFAQAYQKVPIQAYNTKIPMITLTDTQYVWVRDDSFQIIDVAK
ncbi:peptidase E [Candidatus Pacebacteria bacterium]|nr:peptidase E [Candidatus Paceibacterota bacterium]